MNTHNKEQVYKCKKVMLLDHQRQEKCQLTIIAENLL